jgi:cellulose synthase/poly-beta-1,6-N-acetylglucosamine synthase-like glycosyltransferase
LNKLAGTKISNGFLYATLIFDMLTFSENPSFYHESLELPDEAIFAGGPFDRSDMRLRRQVLRETVQHFKNNTVSETLLFCVSSNSTALGHRFRL